jgi:hypothetical protein
VEHDEILDLYILVPKVTEFAEQDFDDLEDDEILDLDNGYSMTSFLSFFSPLFPPLFFPPSVFPSFFLCHAPISRFGQRVFNDKSSRSVRYSGT